jgi:hypothetical protein
VEWEITVTGDPAVILARTSGAPTVADFFALREEVLAHTAFVPGIDVIYDHTDLSASLSGAEVRAIAEAAVRRSRELPYWGRMAQVVPLPAQYGLARMWEAYAGDDLAARTRIFASLDEAYAWLGATPPSP